MNYWPFGLWTCTLIMDLGGIFLTANGFPPPPCPYFLSLLASLSPSLPVSVLYLNCAFFVFAFLRFCTDV